MALQGTFRGLANVVACDQNAQSYLAVYIHPLPVMAGGVS